MKIEIDWIKEDKFISTVDGKHSLTIDGGRIIAPSAMDFLLVGLGSCTAIDVVDILRKMKEPLTALKVEVEGTRAEEPPRVYTEVKIKYIAKGKIKNEKLIKAIELSQEKYCSASIMFKRSGAKVTYEYEIVED
ncbi:MAG: OsmC family protein [Thermoplasmata archaeon]|nr:OsmC family protein [Thermoplasmata archaeon]